MERKPIYQAVISLKPFLFKEYKDFKSAKVVDSLIIIKKMYKRTHVTSAGNEYDIFNYSLHSDTEFMSKSFYIRKWSIEDIYEGYWGYWERVEKDGPKYSIWDVWNDYSFADPNGELRRKSFRNPENAIKYLISISIYKDWADFGSQNNDIK
ncbi:MAG: hypothetical protein JXB49_37860 [Bacteroidales bacterium]|nr:hypothetical protein [Bacteroidales bacterium]